MKLKYIAIIFSVLFTVKGFSGNENRVGSAGASELLINPWARSSAWGNAGAAHVRGLEAVQLNVAGLAYTSGTEIGFTTTNWLAGAGININSIGLAQKIGESNVLSLGFMTVDYGDIPITTTEIPEGGLGTFSPSNFILSLAYAKEFSSSITGGFTLKLVNEGISNVKTSGVAIDAGVRYVTGEFDHIKFGLALKNVGPPMSFSGDGLAIETINPFTGLSTTTEQRSAQFELPSLVNIAAAYDFLLGETNKITAAGSFTSNSFSRDQFALGAEYTFTHQKVIVILRAGMVMEKGLFDEAERQTALTGPTAGLSLDLPFGKTGSTLGVDYAYRTTSAAFNGIHSIGVRLNLSKGEEE